MAMPQIPPRPNRAQIHQTSTTTILEPPKVPPRPNQHRADRSESPHRDSFARSPLNDAPFATSHGNIRTGLYSSNGQNASSSSLGIPARPPSVSLPSIGQEGNEYADLAYDDHGNATESSSPTQTRNVGSDLPLHAPKPSLSTSNAKARIATVTRTDSSQAAAIGLGKAATPSQVDDKDPYTRSLKPKESFSSTRSSVSTERPSSTQVEDEHGIPEIGQRVPMYPNAGDVQAPSPSPYSQNYPSGIGFHNDGSKSRHHGRRSSVKEGFLGPPGSYGLHGHGLASPDKFEKAWYDKHPDALVREESGQYGPGIGGARGEWAMSSEDLNKIVRDTASRGAGFGIFHHLCKIPVSLAKSSLGTSPNVVARPDEQIGYLASEEYASRLNSPRPQSGPYHNKTHSHSQTHVESPLRKSSFPVDGSGKVDFDKTRESQSGLRTSQEQALESETEEDDDVIHIDAPGVRTSKLLGNGYDPPTEDLGPQGGNTEVEGGWIEETGYGVPILASDEVAKEPGMEYLQPAVAPAQERRGSAYYAGVDSEFPPSYQSGRRHGSVSGSAASSRPTSRPGSIHGSLPGLTKFVSHDEREEMHTPLEDVDEYEPLFPDDEGKLGKPQSPADRFKHRPDMKRRFPSQDIWEDTPNSLQLEATVSTPEPLIGKESEDLQPASAVFETPEVEAARKGEVSEEGRAELLPKEERWARSNFKPHIRDELQRPGMKQRFPSRDIWEDSPDSACLETTVEGPQADELRSPTDEGLIAGAVVHTSGRPVDGHIAGDQDRDGATIGAPALEKPSIPPRPINTKHVQEAQTSTAQPAPSIPARPQKPKAHLIANVTSPLAKGPGESSPIETKQISPTESRKPLLPDRAKPPVPARPAKPVARDSSESIPLSKTTSATSLGSNNDASTAKDISFPPPTTKPKPALPARPAGSKIAALKAGFMSDLDKRLQLGPQAPPKIQEKKVEEDKEEEQAPLTDARKGRAKGPVRRKPAVSSTAPVEMKQNEAKMEIAEPWTIWHVSPENDDGLVVMHGQEPATADLARNVSPTKLEAPGIVRDLQLHGESHEESHTTRTEKSITVPETQESPLQDVIPKQALDDASDIAPAPSTNTERLDHVAQDAKVPTTSTRSSPETANTAAQTGEKIIHMDTSSNAPVKLTAYENALAQHDGDVLVKEEAEAEGEMHTQHAEEV
ncbi:hypothetical protein MMC11_002660 [Xylographa trunciseda]|nr:hypothetical protein [Xylographa trunciseda]